MAMKSGKAAGLDTHGGLEGAKWWLDEAWKATNPNWENLDPYKTLAVPVHLRRSRQRPSGKHLACVGAALRGLPRPRKLAT